MADEVYKKLAGALNSLSSREPVILCDEWYSLAGELFTVEEASIACGMPMKPVTVEELAGNRRGLMSSSYYVEHQILPIEGDFGNIRSYLHNRQRKPDLVKRYFLAP